MLLQKYYMPYRNSTRNVFFKQRCDWLQRCFEAEPKKELDVLITLYEVQLLQLLLVKIQYKSITVSTWELHLQSYNNYYERDWIQTHD